MEITFKNKNILVTGATGFAGSHLVEALVQQKGKIVGTFQSINPQSYFSQQHLEKKVTLIPVDINNFDRMYDVITKYQIDYIFHLAAQPLVNVAYDNPRQTLYTNIIGTINILEGARLFPKVKSIIVASSDKAYGKLNEGKYAEENALKGDHPYEVSKSSADLISGSYFKTYGIPVAVTRFGNIYGEGDLNFSRIIPGIMQSIITKEPLEIRSDGKYVRDYLYVKDVVSGYLKCALYIDKIKGEAFNFGSSETLSVIQLLQMIENNLNIKINYRILNTAKNEIPYQSLDFTKAGKILRWKPNYSIEKTINNILSYYKKIV